MGNKSYGRFQRLLPFFGQSEALLTSSVFQDEHLVMHSIEYVYCIMYILLVPVILLMFNTFSYLAYYAIYR